ncbi:MAG: hypothetical protein ACHP84_02450 [Caulobacterales bacterium]
MNRARLTAGDLVEVRGPGEILATLDGDGRLGGLPFMPEMARMCGRRLRVHRRAEMTCVEGHGLRRISPVILLEAARCDGAAHDGCQRNCLIFWNEAWLRPVEAAAAPAPTPIDDASARRRLEALPTRRGEAYLCQSTALAAISRPMSRWDLGHLLGDLASGQLSFPRFLGLVRRGLVNQTRRRLGMADVGVIAGDDGDATRGDLDLRSGDWVRVRAAQDIRATLGPDGRNRGLSFEPEMTGYIGEVRQVEFPVRRIILEETGAMARLKHTVALRDVTCKGLCAQNCPRANTLYWRESWLERVEQQQAAE